MKVENEQQAIYDDTLFFTIYRIYFSYRPNYSIEKSTVKLYFVISISYCE
jgi:hypothetical protein